MEKEIEITDELIVKYLTGEASPEEAMALQEWQVRSENEKYYADFEAAWNKSHPGKTSRLVSKVEAWKTVSNQLSMRGNDKSFYEKYSTILQAAASIALILAVGAFAFFSRSDSTPAIEQITGNNIERVELPDASVATLSRDTKITYKEEFKGESREVILEGEAFFKVTPDKNKPFIIHTPRVDIKVIGTSFNVNSRNGKLEVSVMEGKVQILSGDKEEFLEAGQTALLVSTTESIEVKNSIDLNVMSYATHRFVFKNTPLVEVFHTIEKSFPTSIDVSNKAIENCRLSATFEDASVEDILSMAAESLNLVVIKDGQTFLLQGEGCP
jgi:transmembrane sensor